MNEFQKVVLSGIGVVTTSVLVFYFSGCSSIDFSKFKYSLHPHVTTEVAKVKTGGEAKGPAGHRQIDPEALDDRSKVSREQRAKLYVQTAVRDYYNGSVENALDRLSRAQQYDPSSYEALRLSGQILYEQNQYRKAFNNWSRATQLPNDDKAIPRDLDVLKRILRYCRHEQDRLQAKIHRNPNDQVANARLKELQQMMQD